MSTPLADRVRPSSLEGVVGQQHLLGHGKVLRRLIEGGQIPNMIFYGPSGTGKTTVANIIAGITNKKLYKLNATNASVADIKAIAQDTKGLSGIGGILLYLDEIQNFNKKQQQSLLEYIEDGRITLIASTTENPYFYIYNAILSRSTVFEFLPVQPEYIKTAVNNAVSILEKDYRAKIALSTTATEHISQTSNGDVRKALNALEICALSKVGTEEIEITLEDAVEATRRKAMRYDRDGDSHYDILSAFQKSIRGSDPDASIHYLARLVNAGDLISICRRLMVIACEDIGLAYPMAATITKSCIDAAVQLGFPEARIPLAEAVILLATAPKSNSAIVAIDAAINDLNSKDTGDIPAHLKDSHYAGAKKMGRGVEYKYPHSYPNNYIQQQYLPNNIKNAKYYNAGINKNEQAAAEYLKRIISNLNV